MYFLCSLPVHNVIHHGLIPDLSYSSRSRSYTLAFDSHSPSYSELVVELGPDAFVCEPSNNILTWARIPSQTSAQAGLAKSTLSGIEGMERVANHVHASLNVERSIQGESFFPLSAAHELEKIPFYVVLLLRK